MTASDNRERRSERLLRAAMTRIVTSTPIRSNGSRTVTALAAEAGVRRRTAARAFSVLREELAEARAKLAERSAEVLRLRSDLAALACRVALLSEEDAQLRGDRAGGVVALPAR